LIVPVNLSAKDTLHYVTFLYVCTSYILLLDVVSHFLTVLRLIRFEISNHFEDTRSVLSVLTRCTRTCCVPVCGMGRHWYLLLG